MVNARLRLAGRISRNVNTSRLTPIDVQFKNLQVKERPPKVSCWVFALTVFVFLLGALLLMTGVLLLAGTTHFFDAIFGIILGLLILYPSSYQLIMVYHAVKGYWRYSYDDIPNFDV